MLLLYHNFSFLVTDFSSSALSVRSQIASQSTNPHQNFDSKQFPNSVSLCKSEFFQKLESSVKKYYLTGP